MLEKLKSFVKPISNWALFTAAVIGAFFIGYYYQAMMKSMNDKPKVIDLKTSERCSISVTDRGEMLILDRTNGNFEVYDEQVGLAVFKAYGARITTNQLK